IMPFEEGRLPVKYLGVPLVPSRFVYKDYKELIEKVDGRINDWKNKSLSISGRLQLMQSVIASCMSTRPLCKAKVAWDVVCLPKDEVGLGVKRLDLFNKALMSSHVWKLLVRKYSLWVKWIHTYKIKHRNFWDIPCRGNMTWGWRKILQLHPLVREFIWYKIGNSQNISIWYDRWCPLSPLANFVSTRDMYRAGLNMSSTVNDVINVAPNSHDKLEWRTHSGAVKKFAVSTVWQAIRTRDVKVAWADVVWFTYCIPRHVFNLWLIMKRILKMQDTLMSWDLASTLVSFTCSLCESQPDSHDHLFFDCSYSKQVWKHMTDLAGLSQKHYNIYDVVSSILPIAKRRTSNTVIIKLVIAASAYFLWQERNERLFKNNKRLVVQVIECITSSIRLKLFLCRFKNSKRSLALMRRWKIPEVILVQK
ncbi:hypothetical protein Tco_0144956, partial [Tanacetum coccineum]